MHVLAENQGVEPCGHITTTYGLAIRCITVLPVLHIETHSNTNVLLYGGSGEIRTHGAFRHDSFQDCCNKPDSATLPQNIQIFKERLQQKTQDFLGLGFVFVRNYELLLYTNPLHSKTINLAICWAI
jgi:hypothetical protein